MLKEWQCRNYIPMAKTGRLGWETLKSEEQNWIHQEATQKYLSKTVRSVDYLEKSSEQGQVLNLASAKRKKKNPGEK